MAMIGRIAVFLALVVALAAVVGKMNPEIFFNIPNIGFVIFYMFGGNNGVVPPYYDLTPWQDNHHNEWLRDGDVVVATGVKSGTTWMCYCVDAIRRKGSNEVGHPYTDIMYTTPWMDLPHQPGETWAHRKDKYNSTILPDGTNLKDYWDNPAFPFRAFKSHYTPIGTGPVGVLPVKERPGVKYIISFRNPTEIAKSVYSFFPKHTAAFQKIWGGFPPHYPDAETAAKALLPGAELYSWFFGYVKAWWPYIHEPNVLALHYSDMVKDVPALVDKLSSFVGVALDTEEKAQVVEKCSFKYMKEHPAFFEYRLPLNTRGTWAVMKPDGMINSGKSSSKNDDQGISVEAKQLLLDAVDNELSEPQLIKWILEGGELSER